MIFTASISRAGLGEGQSDSPEKTASTQTAVKKRQYSITIKGNSHFTEKDLLKAAAAELQMFEQRGMRKADIDDGAFQMRSAYLQAGFAFAFVDYVYEQKDERIEVTFEVEEGPRVFIEKINFAGNEQIGTHTLLDFFTESASLLGRQQNRIFVESGWFLTDRSTYMSDPK